MGAIRMRRTQTLSMTCFLFQVTFNVERSEQCGQWHQVCHVDQNGQCLFWCRDTTDPLQLIVSQDTAGVNDPHKGVQHGNGATNDKLHDLQRGQNPLEQVWHSDVNTAQGKIQVHQGVDEGVKHNKDPNWRRLVSDPGPHAHHGTGVVVALQKRAWSSFQQDDGGVDDFVELGNVEPPSENLQVVEPFVVQDPGEDTTFDITHGVDEDVQFLWLVVGQAGQEVPFKHVHDGADGGGEPNEGPDGVDAQEDVMGQDEELEC